MDMAALGRSIFVVVAGGCYSGVGTPLTDYTTSLIISFGFIHVCICSIFLGVMNLSQISNCISLLNFCVFFWLFIIDCYLSFGFFKT